MSKTYLQTVLGHIGITQAELARRLRWSPQRVGYLVSEDCRSFPFEELWHLKESLHLSDRELAALLREYFTQYGRHV